MIDTHSLTDNPIDFSTYVERHSGDKTIAYKMVDGQPVSLSLFYPQGFDKKQKRTLFLLIHGGGWQSHMIFPEQIEWAGDYLGFLARYYADMGYIAVSIDYRLMRNDGQEPNHQIIDLYDDCMDAIDFLQTNADMLGLNCNRAVILGESAGGYLAAALATLPYRQKNIFSAAILVNAITDFSDDKWFKRLPVQTDHPLLCNRTMEERSELLSPVSHISEETCPVLLIHGDADSIVYPWQSKMFYDKMIQHKNTAELHWLKNTDHAFLLAEYMMKKGIPLTGASVSIKIINDWLLSQNCNPF